MSEDDYDRQKDAHDSTFLAYDYLRNMRGDSRKIVISELPPSANNLFTPVAGRGKVPSPEYKAWTNLALWEIKAQRVHPMKGEVSIHVGIVPKNKRARDLGNFNKAIEDALVKAGVIEDDSWNYLMRATYERVSSGPPVTILVHKYQGATA